MRCPLDLEMFAHPTLLQRLSASELGAVVALLQTAWAEDPPCTLPDDQTFLAMVARTTDSEWAVIRNRVLATLHAAAGASGRLVITVAQRVYQDSQSRQAERSSTRSAAAKARWGQRAAEPPPPAEQPEASAEVRQAGRAAQSVHPRTARATGDPPMHMHALASKTHASASPANALRSSSPPESALTLERSTERENSERSDGEVIAQLGAGARALLEDRLRTWRRQKSQAMLEDAITRWTKSGLTTFPLVRAAELASSAHALPARVESVIAAADLIVTKAVGGAGRKPNPIGMVIEGLGAGSRSTRPWEIPLQAHARWEQLERETLRMAEAQAAIDQRLRAVRHKLGEAQVAGA